MNINISGAKFSAIVGIGQELKKKSRETGTEFLMLNRGINNVVKINLEKLISNIDFNSEDIQFYAPTLGRMPLRNAINQYYFSRQSSPDNIYITAGGMNALNMLFQSLNHKKVYTHEFYWGAYANLFKIMNKEHQFYTDISTLYEKPKQFSDAAVIICDPNNPLGDKFDDDKLIETANRLTAHNATVIWDGPYRKLFTDENDDFYTRLSKNQNIIICESFSKSVGLSGQRIGFIHTLNKSLKNELSVRMLYSANGVNAFAQILIEQILNTPEGKKAADDFKTQTKQAIQSNIKYLREKKILADILYKDTEPQGIFVVVQKSYQELLEKNIGSVPISYFTKKPQYTDDKYARICVSVPHKKFVNYFSRF